MTPEKQFSALITYEVQTHTLIDGWINTWTYEDSDGVMRPETFATKQAAQAALDEYLQELSEEVALGNIINYDRDEFRIHSVPDIATTEGGVA